MKGRAPEWEARLWSFVGCGNGEQCPLLDNCQIRRERGWCSNDDSELLSRLVLEEFSNSQETYNFIKCGTCHTVSVELLADKCLERAGISCPPVQSELVPEIFEQDSVDIHLLPLKAYHGAVWHTGDKWVIQLKECDTLAGQNFTLFHEVFHILAHLNCNPAFRKIGTRSGSFNEMLADYFASSILMPQEWVRKKWASTNNVDLMAEIFEVPRSSMFIRLKYLGLI